MKKISDEQKDKVKGSSETSKVESKGERVTTGQENITTKNDEDVGISADNLFKVISREWISEVKKLRFKTTQCQVKKKRESVFDSKVQSGHAEIEGDNLLFI